MTQKNITEYRRLIKEAAELDDRGFQNWFTHAESLDHSLVSGFWDFSIHMLTDKVCECIERPYEKTALEIGYGGGRILRAACRFFKHVTGIDIHEEQERVRRFLDVDNYTLIKTDDEKIDVPDGSIDFVYSFIVFLHLTSYEQFIDYMKEVRRILAPGGVAQIYYGARENGTIENINQKPNTATLMINPEEVHRDIPGLGFEIIDSGTSFKSVPDGYSHQKGCQRFITLR